MLLLLKNLLFTFVVPGTVAVYLPLTIAERAAALPVWRWPGALVLFAAGGAIYAWCVWDFATFGRGTPAPIDAPQRLVVRGLYRYIRNPMYVGVLTVILGWTVLYAQRALLLYFVGVAALFGIVVVLFEEPLLRRLFGDDYVAYCARVGRWLPRSRG